MSVKNMAKTCFKAMNEMLDAGTKISFELSDYKRNLDGTWDGVKIEVLRNVPSGTDSKQS